MAREEIAECLDLKSKQGERSSNEEKAMIEFFIEASSEEEMQKLERWLLR